MIRLLDYIIAKCESLINNNDTDNTGNTNTKI
jgi:hypothetical protein